MKLFLTSSGLSSDNESAFIKLLGQDPTGLKVAFIPTAMNPETEEARQQYMPEDVADLESLGMIVSFIDLEQLDEKNIIETFSPFDIIYVYGGNTFYLMNQANRSGFKKHIREIIKDKVYFGVSAGSIIAGPDISIAGWPGGDSNDVKLEDMSGLGLISYAIKPHWKGENPPEAKDYNFDIRYIQDGAAITQSEATKQYASVIEEVEKIYETGLSIPAEKNNPNFFICPVGFIGAGKSTVLNLLEKKLSFVRISTDALRRLLRERNDFNGEHARAIGYKLIKKYSEAGYNVAIDANCSRMANGGDYEESFNKMVATAKAKVFWIHINPPEEFIVNKLKKFKHTWLFQNGEEAAQTFLSRRHLVNKENIPFTYTFDTSKDNLEEQATEAAKLIRQGLM